MTFLQRPTKIVHKPRSNKKSTQVICDQLEVMIAGYKDITSSTRYRYFTTSYTKTKEEEVMNIFSGGQIIMSVKRNIEDDIIGDIFLGIGSLYQYLRPNWRPIRELEAAERIALLGNYGIDEYYAMEEVGFYTLDLINGLLDLLGRKCIIPWGVKFFIDREAGVPVLGNPDEHPDWDSVAFRDPVDIAYILVDQTEEEGRLSLRHSYSVRAKKILHKLEK